MFELRPYQLKAVDFARQHAKALIIAPTGSGKTAMACSLLEPEKINIVIVPTGLLVDQTIKAIKSFLNIEASVFSATKQVLTNITVSTWQSLASAIKRGYVPSADLVIADEAHKVGIKTLYYEIIKTINPTKFYAITATPTRHDDVRPLYALCENITHWIPITDLYEKNYLIKPDVYLVKTNINYVLENSLTPWENKVFSDEQKIGRLKKIIGEDKKRNEMLTEFILENHGRFSLVLSYTHAQTERLFFFCRKSEKLMLHGGLSSEQKKQTMQRIEEDTGGFILFATQSFFGEGVDVPKLDTLFITSPFGGGAKTIQFAGRILRPHQGKKQVNIFDFCDNFEGVGESWESRRKNDYKKKLVVDVYPRKCKEIIEKKIKYSSALGQNFYISISGDVVFDDGTIYTRAEIQTLAKTEPADLDLKKIHNAKSVFSEGEIRDPSRYRK